MALGRGGPARDETRASNSIRENMDVVSDDEGENATETPVFRIRGLSSLPPPIPNEADHPLIQQNGDTQWTELPKLGKDRRPASVLTSILRDHHPGIVEYNGKSVAAMKWVHYQVKVDSNGRSKADEVDEEFWLRFRFEPDYECVARQQVGRCADILLNGIKYYARIQAIQDHYLKVKNRQLRDKIAGQQYLTKEQYFAQKPVWCNEEAWNALADDWCDPKFREKSEKNRANRASSKYKPHRGGSNSIATVCQKLNKGGM